MSPDDFDRLQSLMSSRAGFRLTRDRMKLAEHRLGPVARREGFETVDAMLGSLWAKPVASWCWKRPSCASPSPPPSKRSSPPPGYDDGLAIAAARNARLCIPRQDRHDAGAGPACRSGDRADKRETDNGNGI